MPFRKYRLSSRKGLQNIQFIGFLYGIAQCDFVPDQRLPDKYIYVFPQPALIVDDIGRDSRINRVQVSDEFSYRLSLYPDDM